jgi:hypothetical protein
MIQRSRQWKSPAFKAWGNSGVHAFASCPSDPVVFQPSQLQQLDLFLSRPVARDVPTCARMTSDTFISRR